MKIASFLSGLLLLGSASAGAGPILQSSVTPLGGSLFHYEFSVTNNTADDIVVVSIDAPTGDATIGATLVAPPGFMAGYDPGLGSIDFLEDTDLFSVGSTISGFAFDSTFGPLNGKFENFTALTLNGDTLSGNVETTVVGSVPEPGSLALLALGFGALLFGGQRGLPWRTAR